MCGSNPCIPVKNSPLMRIGIETDSGRFFHADVNDQKDKWCPKIILNSSHLTLNLSSSGIRAAFHAFSP